MICREGDRMYSAKVSNSMIIDKKGKIKLNDFKIRVDGFSEPSLLERAKKEYNAGKDLTRVPYKSKDWPEGTWHDLYWDMRENFLRWRKRSSRY